MEIEWRRLGWTVAEFLLQISTTGEAVTAAEAVHRRLTDRANRAVLSYMGVIPSTDVDTAADMVATIADLERARREIGRISAMHRMAGLLFALYAAHRGVQVLENWLWPQWEARCTGAAGHFDAALRSLLSAGSHYMCPIDLSPTAGTPPLNLVPSRRGIVAPAPAPLAARARDDAAMVLDEVRHMQGVVYLQMADACMIILN